MSKVKGYPLIDCFRIIAAILVVTIHTSPLDTISPTLDFYLTRGLGRIAVPFFFITTAYFYFLNPSKKRLYKIIKQTLLIYLATIIIYFNQIIYVFLSIFLYLLKCPQSLILSALRAFCFCGKPHISRSIFLYCPYLSWLKSW